VLFFLLAGFGALLEMNARRGDALRNPEPEPRNPEPETRNPLPATGGSA